METLNNTETITITNKCNLIVFSLEFDQGIINCYLSLSILQDLMTLGISDYIDDYIYFIAPADFSYIIAISSNISNYNQTICKALFNDDAKLIENCALINPDNLDSTTNITIIGYNSYILGSLSFINIELSIYLQFNHKLQCYKYKWIYCWNN